MSDTIPQSVLNGCRKYVKSRIIINTFNTFNNVAPEAETITVQTEQFIAAISLRTKRGHYMQYDGIQVHDEVHDYGTIVGPASEYVGTVNEAVQVDEDDIFDD